MVVWHHQLNGHEFEQDPEDSEGQGSLACSSLWHCKESDTTEGLNNNQRSLASLTCYPQTSLSPPPATTTFTLCLRGICLFWTLPVLINGIRHYVAFLFLAYLNTLFSRFIQGLPWGSSG